MIKIIITFITTLFIYTLVLLSLFHFQVIDFKNNTNCDEIRNDAIITNDNILKKLNGCWKSDRTLSVTEDGNELFSYLCFYDKKAIKEGYDGLSDVTIYSLSHMHFGDQDWSYEYIDNSNLIFGNNKYHRISDIDVNDFFNGEIYNK